MIPVLLAGNLLAIVLGLRGAAVLHASAVELNGAAIAFVGPTGAGKSTAAALLCAAGGAIVGDDAARVEDREGAPLDPPRPARAAAAPAGRGDRRSRWGSDRHDGGRPGRGRSPSGDRRHRRGSARSCFPSWPRGARRPSVARLPARRALELAPALPASDRLARPGPGPRALRRLRVDRARSYPPSARSCPRDASKTPASLMPCAMRWPRPARSSLRAANRGEPPAPCQPARRRDPGPRGAARRSRADRGERRLRSSLEPRPGPARGGQPPARQLAGRRARSRRRPGLRAGTRRARRIRTRLGGGRATRRRAARGPRRAARGLRPGALSAGAARRRWSAPPAAWCPSTSRAKASAGRWPRRSRTCCGSTRRTSGSTRWSMRS